MKQAVDQYHSGIEWN